MKFELSAYDMRAILEEAISGVESSAALKNIAINEDYHCEPLVKMDAKLMETIVRNLLNNAIKFSDNGSEVFVRMICDKKNVVVEVQDFGVGIEPERIEELFKVGKIRPSMGANNETGSGFGLNIVNKLVAKLTGKLDINSEVGKRTINRLTFAQTS